MTETDGLLGTPERAIGLRDSLRTYRPSQVLNIGRIEYRRKSGMSRGEVFGRLLAARLPRQKRAVSDQQAGSFHAADTQPAAHDGDHGQCEGEHRGQVKRERLEMHVQRLYLRYEAHDAAEVRRQARARQIGRVSLRRAVSIRDRQSPRGMRTVASAAVFGQVLLAGKRTRSMWKVTGLG